MYLDDNVFSSSKVVLGEVGEILAAQVVNLGTGPRAFIRP